MERPGANRPAAARDAAGYGRETVEYVLQDRTWQDWHELLEWLRAEGVDDPQLGPGELRALRQDAERAATRGAPFDNDADRMWRELKQ